MFRIFKRIKELEMNQVIIEKQIEAQREKIIAQNMKIEQIEKDIEPPHTF